MRLSRTGPIGLNKVSNQEAGLGLGLTLCRAIVEAHGGWNQAENQGSGGVVFSFTLPLEQAPPGMESEAAG